MAYFEELIKFNNKWYFKFHIQEKEESISKLYLSSRYTSQKGWKRQMERDYKDRVNSPEGPAGLIPDGPRDVQRHGNINMIWPGDYYLMSLYPTKVTPDQNQYKMKRPLDMWKAECLETSHSAGIKLGTSIIGGYIGTSEVVFSNTMTGESFASRYQLTIENAAGLGADISAITIESGEGTRFFPAGMNFLDVAKSYEGPFETVSGSFSFLSGSSWEGTGDTTNEWNGWSVGLTIGVKLSALSKLVDKIFGKIPSSPASATRINCKLVLTESGELTDTSLAKKIKKGSHEHNLHYFNNKEDYWKAIEKTGEKKKEWYFKRLKQYYHRNGVPKTESWNLSSGFLDPTI